MTDSARTDDRVRPRALLLGVVLAMAICALTPYHNIHKQGTPLGGGHFPLAPFFLFFWLVLFAAAAGRIFGRAVLTGRELLTVWMLTVLVSGIAYTGLVRTFFLNLTAPFHFATPGNRWREILHPLLPATWFPGDPEAVALFYNGLADGRRMGWFEVLANIPWASWAGPLMVWGAFVLLCYGVMICLTTLLSRQWIRNERMNMPLLRVPLLMEEALDRGRMGRFLADRFLLAGLALPVMLHLVNGLAFYHPTVPEIPTLILAGPYFPGHGLLSGFQKLRIHIYPAFIGFAFLTSRQISFSFWVFFVLGGLLFGLLATLGYVIPAAALGPTFGPTLARPEETQMVGAYLVFFLFLLWLARHHLLAVVRAATGRGEYPADPAEWFPAPMAFRGAAGGGLLAVLWLAYFGMPLAAAALTVAAFFLFAVVAARTICQGGVAYFTLTAAPIDGILAFFGPGFFSRSGLVAAAVVQKVLFVDLRESLMPSLVHAAGVTHRTRNRRTVFLVMSVVLVLGLAVSFAAMLALCYKFGARELRLDWATGSVVHVYDNLVTLLEAPERSRKWVTIFSAAGALVMLGLVIGYHRFIRWPLHPLGYLTAYSSAMRILWFSFFLGWLCNSLCMRYGGVGLFRRFRMFFAGLIVGDFLMGGLWAAVGLFADLSYPVLPG